MIHIFAQHQKIEVHLQQLRLCQKSCRLQMVQKKERTKESMMEKVKEQTRGWTSHWATSLRRQGCQFRVKARQMAEMMAAKIHSEQRAPLGLWKWKAFEMVQRMARTIRWEIQRSRQCRQKARRKEPRMETMTQMELGHSLTQQGSKGESRRSSLCICRCSNIKNTRKLCGVEHS
jgi:hypothetical protein